MTFELGSIAIRELRLGARNALRDGVLSVDAEGLQQHILDADARLAFAVLLLLEVEPGHGDTSEGHVPLK